ncbi:hypothetical protein CASFOL_009752 [Castilleja foliolosa]|uniref:GOLD domain-containing protein n=1 Tax=Castilleja foliolosa TaxID=1961234 RepID=A0ABD3DSG5_9LAMI
MLKNWPVTMNIKLQRQKLCLVLVSILWLWTRAGSIRFDMESGHTKCITEDIKINSMTVGKYQIVNPNEGYPLPDSHKVTVRVTSAHGNNYHSSENVNEGHFAFQTSEAGDYMACFFAADHNPSTSITVDFDWKSGIAAKDWTNVAKKGSVESMELELKKMFDTVQLIHDEMFYLRDRRNAATERIYQLENGVAEFSVALSFVVCGWASDLAFEEFL